jgi:hypothetical protein
MRITLVHTGTDPYYAAMTQVCALCVKTAIPGCTITLHATQSASETLKQVVANPFPFDELCIEKPPHDDPVFQNRWIKTCLRNKVKGDFVYIDCDVVVRKGFENIINLIERERADVGLCLDWNDDSVQRSRQRAIDENYWDAMRHFDWSIPNDGYCNGGVIAWRDTARSRELSQKWHELWLESTATGVYRDQPALNHALSICPARRLILPPVFNAVVHSTVEPCPSPFAVHFFCSLGSHRQSLLEDAVTCLTRRGSIRSYRIKELVSTHDPYANARSIRQSFAAGDYLRTTTNLLRRVSDLWRQYFKSREAK